MGMEPPMLGMEGRKWHHPPPHSPQYKGGDQPLLWGSLRGWGPLTPRPRAGGRRGRCRSLGRRRRRRRRRC